MGGHQEGGAVEMSGHKGQPAGQQQPNGFVTPYTQGGQKEADWQGAKARRGQQGQPTVAAACASDRAAREAAARAREPAPGSPRRTVRALTQQGGAICVQPLLPVPNYPGMIGCTPHGH
jgi:hypothetical protein